MSGCCDRARRDLIASLRSFGVDVPGMFDEPSAGAGSPQPAEHVFIQREDDLTDPWCMCCDAVKRPSAGAGSPSTPTPATHEFRFSPPSGSSHTKFACTYGWGGPGYCGRREDNPVHVQRDERAERGNGGRDPHCALPHPHGRSNRCAGD